MTPRAPITTFISIRWSSHVLPSLDMKSVFFAALPLSLPFRRLSLPFFRLLFFDERSCAFSCSVSSVVSCVTSSSLSSTTFVAFFFFFFFLAGGCLASGAGLLCAGSLARFDAEVLALDPLVFFFACLDGTAAGCFLDSLAFVRCCCCCDFLVL